MEENSLELDPDVKITMEYNGHIVFLSKEDHPKLKIIRLGYQLESEVIELWKNM